MDDPREADRLRAKVDSKQWLAKYLRYFPEQASRMLDVGCGAGSITMEVAGKFPGCSIRGVDLSAERFFDSFNSEVSNLRFAQGDANSLPFPEHEFGFVWSRFLLQFLPNKQNAIAEMVRVCEPGGQVMIQDLDGQLVWHYPEDESLQLRLNRVLAGLAETGFDPFTGRKLFSMMLKAGLTDIQVQIEPYHLFAGPIDEVNLSLWRTKLSIAQRAGNAILGSETESQRLCDDFLAYLQRPDKLTYSVVFTVIGTKPVANENVQSN